MRLPEGHFLRSVRVTATAVPRPCHVPQGVARSWPGRGPVVARSWPGLPCEMQFCEVPFLDFLGGGRRVPEVTLFQLLCENFGDFSSLGSLKST